MATVEGGAEAAAEKKKSKEGSAGAKKPRAPPAHPPYSEVRFGLSLNLKWFIVLCDRKF